MAVTMANVLAPSIYDLFYYLFNISAGAEEGVGSGGAIVLLYGVLLSLIIVGQGPAALQ